MNRAERRNVRAVPQARLADRLPAPPPKQMPKWMEAMWFFIYLVLFFVAVFTVLYHRGKNFEYKQSKQILLAQDIGFEKALDQLSDIHVMKILLSQVLYAADWEPISAIKQEYLCEIPLLGRFQSSLVKTAKEEIERIEDADRFQTVSIRVTGRWLTGQVISYCKGTSSSHCTNLKQAWCT